jgi:hypothetical protein
MHLSAQLFKAGSPIFEQIQQRTQASQHQHGKNQAPEYPIEGKAGQLSQRVAPAGVEYLEGGIGGGNQSQGHEQHHPAGLVQAQSWGSFADGLMLKGHGMVLSNIFSLGSRLINDTESYESAHRASRQLRPRSDDQGFESGRRAAAGTARHGAARRGGLHLDRQHIFLYPING